LPKQRDLFLRRLEEVALQQPSHAALLTEGKVVTYGELWQSAARVAAFLAGEGVHAGDRVAFLGRRTAHDFIFILGIWLAGAAYVSLNHKFPPERNRKILAAAAVRGVLVGPHSSSFADELAAGSGERIAIPELEASYWRSGALTSETEDPNLAYVMFTSGSTGAPKGVPITFANLEAFLTNLQALYPAYPGDRMSQLADLSFDASVQEFAWCWWVGATLCPVPASGALMWPRYAQELNMSVMLLIPSFVVLAKRARLLGGGTLPDLRLAFLGAEAVTRDVVRAVHEAAPNALLVNLWGPTETTVFFTHFQIDPTQELGDVVPIGQPFPDQLVEIWDEDSRPVAPGARGELVQSGSQVTPGYWRNPEANQQRFLARDGLHWYRSGDMAMQDPEVGLRYLGRVDRQVKVNGYRVELLECESAIRLASGCDQVAVVPLIRDGQASAESLVCFLAGQPVDVDALKAELKKRLPDYMVPGRFEQLDALPLGATGKTDLLALQARLRP
jgi:amino acid adenylation domain-containing protein